MFMFYEQFGAVNDKHKHDFSYSLDVAKLLIILFSIWYFDEYLPMM